MEPRARTRTLLRRAGILAALLALILPALAGTASASHRHAAKHHAGASAKHKKSRHKHKKSKLPVVTSVHPLNASIGDTLVVRGHNFRRGVNKNTVAFRRSGARVVFVKARIATKKMLKVVLPDSLGKVLKASNGAFVPTRLQIRVLAKKFGKRYTRRGLSPLVSPRRPPVVTPPVAAADGDCDGDHLKNSVDPDDDNDLLSDTVEARLHTDPCNADSDGDGVTDGYEYQSAIDLNDDEYRGTQDITPAPVKKPYPNPLFPDANVDYDGDSLTLGVEYKLWAAYRNPNLGLTDPSTGDSELIYSDGNQYSAYRHDPADGHRPGALLGADPKDKYLKDASNPADKGFIPWAKSAGFWKVQYKGDQYWLDDFNHSDPLDPNDPTPPANADPAEARWYDFDQGRIPQSDPRWGKLSDDERDEDADGLSNYDEVVGRMQPGYWAGCYPTETAYPVSYAGTDPTDPDTDGDGVRDGADDQDHDDVPNLMELSRLAAGGTDQGICGKPDSSAVADAFPMDVYVNPFNPCEPDPRSRTCLLHPALTNPPAPFGDAKLYAFE